MKKLFVAAIFTLVVIGFASCKSDCVCTFSYDGEEDSVTYKDLKSGECKGVEKAFKQETKEGSIKCVSE